MVSQNVLPGLFQWKDVHSPFQAYGTKNFKVFLPPNGKLVVGEPYFIVRDTKSFTSLNRYRPPRPLPKHAIIHSILAQFHPQVFLQSRFGPIGTVAVVKAKNEDMVEVWFRWVTTPSSVMCAAGSLLMMYMHGSFMCALCMVSRQVLSIWRLVGM